MTFTVYNEGRWSNVSGLYYSTYNSDLNITFRKILAEKICKNILKNIHKSN